MATFRKYGGTNFSPISNIVRHNILNSKSSSFNTSGLYNSKETHLSHIDMSGNSLLHVGNLYFQDGTSMSSAQVINPGLQQVLINNPSAGDKTMTNVRSIGYSNNGGNQTSAYTGYMTSGTYKYATLTLDSNGKMTNIVSNTTTTGGLSEVLSTSGNGGGNSMTNLGSIEQTTGTTSLQETQFNGNITQFNGLNTLNATKFDGNITQSSGSNTLNATKFDGNITQTSNYIYQSGTGTNKNTLKATQFSGDIEQTSNYIYQSGTGTNKNTLKATQFSGNIEQASDYIINQLGTGINKNTLKATDFGGDIIQLNGSNILKDTKFDGNISQSSGSNTLNATTFSENITQDLDKIIIQSGTGTPINELKGTEFKAKCSYVSSVGNFSDNDIPNKSYVDSVSSGLRPTSSCKYATTEDIPLTSISTPFEVDGYDVQNGDRVLVKSQGGTNNENTNNVHNGIYVYDVNSENLTRATDCDLGDNITNQILLVENGNLNGSNAFVQINPISDFVPDTDKVQYIKFSPMKLDFQLGNGLEAITTSTPKILQVKSNLDFLTNVKINGVLDINNSGGMNNPLIKMKVSNSDRLKYFTNLTGGNFNGIIQEGDSAMIIYDNPLSIAYNNTSITSGIRIGSDNIKLYSNTTNYYNLNSSGHNFNGNFYFNNTVTFNSSSSISADGATITPKQLSYVSDATSNIQTQLTGKATLSETNAFSGNNTFSGTDTFTGSINLNGNNYLNGDIIADGATITPTELSCLDGLTNNIQYQLNLKASLNENNTFSGTNTFTSNVNLNGSNTFDGTNTFNSNVTFNKNITVTGNSDLKIGPDLLNMYANLSGICQSGDVGDTTGWNDFNGSNWLYASRVTSIYDNITGPFGTSTQWYNLINVRHRGGIGESSTGGGNLYGCQIVTGMTSNTNRMAFRGQNVGSWTSWNEVAVLGNNNTFSGTNTFSNTTTFNANIIANSTQISPTQLSYVSGSTSNIQSQLNNKGSIIKGIDKTNTDNLRTQPNSVYIEYINSLDSNSSYIMIASAYLNYLSGQGDAVTLKSINLYLEFYLSTVKVSSSRITIGTITKYASTSSGSEKAYYPFSVYISGITKIIYNFSTTTNSGIGSWDTGIHNCTFIRLT